MGNRIIKESICSSDTLDGLSWFEEVFFYRLIVNCDDYGRMDARPAILKARLFPLKDIRPQQIEQAVDRLASAGIVDRYTANGQSYLQIVTWSKHQTVRNKKSKYPEPEQILQAHESNLQTSEFNCNQLNSIEINCCSNPIQSESNPNPNPNPERRACARVVTPDCEEGLRYFQANIRPIASSTDAEMIVDAINDKGLADFKAAVDRTRAKGGRTLKYCLTVLYEKRKYKAKTNDVAATTEQAEQLLRERKEQYEL